MNEVRRSKQGQDEEKDEDMLEDELNAGEEEAEDGVVSGGEDREEQEPSAEIYEKVVYEIKAVNRRLALLGLDLLLQSQDKLVKIRQTKSTTFEANVLVFRLRDF